MLDNHITDKEETGSYINVVLQMDTDDTMTNEIQLLTKLKYRFVTV